MKDLGTMHSRQELARHKPCSRVTVACSEVDGSCVESAAYLPWTEWAVSGHIV